MSHDATMGRPTRWTVAAVVVLGLLVPVCVRAQQPDGMDLSKEAQAVGRRPLIVRVHGGFKDPRVDVLVASSSTDTSGNDLKSTFSGLF